MIRVVIAGFFMVFVALCGGGALNADAWGKDSVLKESDIKLLDELLLNYRPKDTLYFVHACMLETDIYHKSDTRYILFLGGAGGELLKITNGSLYQVSFISFLKGEFFMESQGGVWSSVLAQDVFDSMIKERFSVARQVSAQYALKLSNERSCNMKYKGMDILNKRSDGS